MIMKNTIMLMNIIMIVIMIRRRKLQLKVLSICCFQESWNMLSILKFVPMDSDLRKEPWMKPYFIYAKDAASKSLIKEVSHLKKISTDAIPATSIPA